MNIKDSSHFVALSTMIFNKINCQTISYAVSELVFNIMMQKNSNYSLFWAQFSDLTQIPEEQLIKEFISLSIKTIVKRNQTIQYSNTLINFKQSVFRKSSQSSELFRQQFISNLKLSLYSQFNYIEFQNLSQQELCTFIKDNNVQENIEFWKEFTNMFPNKTTKQIRDYYNKAFQKVLYTQQLTVYDKANLHALNQIWAEEPPAFIAKKFALVSEESGYFPQNVIMYVVNLRNNAKKMNSVKQDRNQ
ncbi:Hypothetical_protein [Hexamita inflata]|uniref:Hypothetical_protein n=1 Tax=Hexamita inflata TaxID=28002 RepID=A0AA86NFV3_9EUKA|nr:Hypothetical protein HINF_LOCUS6777 [Hexamita inflata]